MKYEIKNIFSGNIIYQNEAESFAALVQAAIKAGANLQNANLYGANLQNADLQNADLYRANLQNADLYRANLYGANLQNADLQNADLQNANLYGADLQNANLQNANLQNANLYGANLLNANLQNADLYCANLLNANLYGANLQNAKNLSELKAAQTSILPEGPCIGWKKCQNQVIVKLLIPAKARKSNASGRKCRAEFVKVLEVFGAEVGVSTHDGKTIYRKGETVTCNSWDEDRWVECGGGIHFFITRVEAENY